VPRSERGTTESPAARDTSSPTYKNSLLLDEQQQQEVDAVIAAITEATGCEVFGTLEDRVRQLVADAGGDRLLDEAPGIDPTGMRAPAFVDALTRRVRGGAASAQRSAQRDRDRRERELRAELAGYQTDLGALRALGASDDETDVREILANIDRCEAELAALEMPESA
jgi:hypothetical protein